MRGGCVFCDYDGPSAVLRHYSDAIIIEPFSPVTPGHVLVVPQRHVIDLGDTWAATAAIVAASRYLYDVGLPEYNLIASVGEYATQSVPHLHFHVVPRRKGDGLALPWSNPAKVQSEALLRVVRAARGLIDGMGMGTAGHLDRLRDALAAWEFSQ